MNAVVLIFILALDFLLRVPFQKTPTQEVKPYLLLPVKRNIEHRTSGPLGLLRQIGQKLFPRRSSGHMLQFPGEHFILLRKHSQKIADQPPVELTG